MTAVHEHLVGQSVESLTDEIGRIVAERQTLRAEAAAANLLEENRLRLIDAQARLTQLLIARHHRR